MNPTVRARIHWLSEADGGRKSPPAGPLYSTAARFDELKERWPDVAWSLVLNLSGVADQTVDTIAEVALLSPEAPPELIKPGSLFELFEGNRLVATGQVLP